MQFSSAQENKGVIILPTNFDLFLNNMLSEASLQPTTSSMRVLGLILFSPTPDELGLLKSVLAVDRWLVQHLPHLPSQDKARRLGLGLLKLKRHWEGSCKSIALGLGAY